VSVGHDPARFWGLTMREAEREFRGTAKIRERETNERLWLAWHIVALDRTEKLPKLDTLMIKSAAPKPKQSGEQMLAMMKAMFLAFGGDATELRTEQ
jgi:hypothetical protein